MCVFSHSACMEVLQGVAIGEKERLERLQLPDTFGEWNRAEQFKLNSELTFRKRFHPEACEAQFGEAFELEDDVKDHAQIQVSTVAKVDLGEVQVSKPFG